MSLLSCGHRYRKYSLLQFSEIQMVKRHLSVLQVPGWDPLMDDMKLENAWVFAKDDSIPGAVKAFLDFEKRLLEPIPKPDRIKVKLTDIPGTKPLPRSALFRHGTTRHLSPTGRQSK